MIDRLLSSKINIRCRNPIGHHNMVVHEWGDSKNKSVILCLHGFTRAAQDFSLLAASLATEHRILAPDLVGRGYSDWLPNENLYQISQYIDDLQTMINRLKIKEVNIIGTSLGGLLGLLMSSSVSDDEFKKHPLFFSGAPVSRTENEIIFNSLVINDFGAQVPIRALFELAGHIDFDPEMVFGDFHQAEILVKKLCSDFGPHSEMQWKILTESFLRPGELDGTYMIHFDPAIVSHFRRILLLLGGKFNNTLFKIPDLNFWTFYEHIKCNTLLFRGKNSKLLEKTIAGQMSGSGPKPKLVEVPNTGHAPTLMHFDQISIIRNFLSV